MSLERIKSDTAILAAHARHHHLDEFV